MTKTVNLFYAGYFYESYLFPLNLFEDCYHLDIIRVIGK